MASLIDVENVIQHRMNLVIFIYEMRPYKSYMKIIKHCSTQRIICWKIVQRFVNYKRLRETFADDWNPSLNGCINVEYYSCCTPFHFPKFYPTGFFSKVFNEATQLLLKKRGRKYTLPFFSLIYGFVPMDFSSNVLKEAISLSI